MQSKNKSTDQELLERGWARMSNRLDNEYRTLGKWDLSFYLIASISILVISLLSLSHHHDEVTHLAHTEIQTSSLSNSPAEPKSTIKLNDSSLNKSNSIAHQVEEKVENKVSTQSPNYVTADETLSQSSTTPSLVNDEGVQYYQTSTTRPETELKIRGNWRGVDLGIAAQLSIPVTTPNFVSINKTNKESIDNSIVNVSTAKSNQTVNSLNYLTNKNIKRLVYEKEGAKVVSNVNLKKQRKLIPQLSAGYAYSFIARSGYNVGFGLNHDLSNLNNLSFTYALNFTHFQDFYSRQGLGTRTGDVGVFQGGVGIDNESEGEATNMVVDYNSVKASVTSISQLGLSFLAQYRLSPRFSIGGGTTLVYQKINATLENQDDVLNFSDQMKADYDQFLDEVENQYRMTIDLKGSWHVAPRLLIQPYWKIQPSKSLFSVNQIGIDLSMRLSQK